MSASKVSAKVTLPSVPLASILPFLFADEEIAAAGLFIAIVFLLPEVAEAGLLNAQALLPHVFFAS